jgi:uncharacterized lipoprotein YddW (UPF0748 family)
MPASRAAVPFGWFWRLMLCASLGTPALSQSQSLPLIPPFPRPHEISSGEQTPPAQLLENGLRLPAFFANGAERAYWDIPLPVRIPSQTTALELDLSCSAPHLLRGLSVHLKSGNGWHSQSLLLVSAARHAYSLPRGAFQAEDQPGPWEKARTLRISAWRNAAASGEAALLLHAVGARTDSVAIVRGTDRTAPGESALAAGLSDRCARLLTKAGLPFAVIDDGFDSLDAFKLLLLPYAPALSDSQCKRLVRHLERGGKLIVFYNASQPLASAMGVRIGAWQGADPGCDWSALVCDPAALPFAPARVPHFTSNLLPPFPASDHRARVLARWADEAGRATDLPACVLSDRGAWFAHIPPLASAPAADLLRLLACALDPELQQPAALAALRDNRALLTSEEVSTLSKRRKIEAAFTARSFQEIPPLCRDLRNACAAATLAATPARPRELRGVWEPRSNGRSRQGREKLMQAFSRSGVNAVFAHWQSAGTAYYRSAGKRAEAACVARQPSDALADASAAAARNGVALHAWATCWTLEGSSERQRAQLADENRLMRDASGQTLPWLCPSLPENRRLIIDGLCDLAKRNVQGIHLDYVRYPDTQGCYAPATRKAFEAQRGHPVARWPSDVVPGGPQAAEFLAFKSATMTAFVREAREALRAAHPGIQLSAAVYPSPEAAARQSQDWPAWVKNGLVDFVCPMIYTESEAAFSALLDTCCAAVPLPEKQIVAGIGTGADESQLDAFDAARQIQNTRTRRTAGFAFFAVDEGLLTGILPNLCLYSQNERDLR